ncbi:hypothetical protein DAMA08_004640 [Martiniozyma asiatica (nom. inval.)]|nr:hypothetical protein DAMA08_004640 [Martiniozyma asiatica]
MLSAGVGMRSELNGMEWNLPEAQRQSWWKLATPQIVGRNRQQLMTIAFPHLPTALNYKF